jgi:CBS domain-containing protein
MQAKDIMSREVVTVTPTDTALHAIRLMLQHRFSGLPVVDAAGELVGVVTEGDFLRRPETGTMRRRPRWLEFIMGPGRLAAEYAQEAGRRVGEVMTHEVHTVTEATPVRDIVDTMERKHVKRVPVVRGRQVVGMVTRQNLMRALVGSTPRSDATAVDDATLRERVLAALAGQPWAPLTVDAVVHDGNVRLVGAILDDRQRDAIRVAVENTPGVRTVEDQLAFIEPTSGMVIEPRAA